MCPEMEAWPQRADELSLLNGHDLILDGIMHFVAPLRYSNTGEGCMIEVHEGGASDSYALYTIEQYSNLSIKKAEAYPQTEEAHPDTYTRFPQGCSWPDDLGSEEDSLVRLLREADLLLRMPSAPKLLLPRLCVGCSSLWAYHRYRGRWGWS